PLTLSAMDAVHRVHGVHIDAARNFGLRGLSVVRRVLYPAVLPQLIVGLRIALGIAWLVVVAAEMIAVSSGMGAIGAIGLILDLAMRQLERLPAIRWGVTPS